MHVTVVRHHAEDSPGLIGAAFEARGARITTHLFPDEGALPAAGDADHVVVLGAVPSVYDDGPAHGVQRQRWLDAGAGERARQAGQDPDAFLAETVMQEPAARARADALVAAAVLLARA